MTTTAILEGATKSAEPMGMRLRRRRRRLGLTLDDLAARARISKPYLSLIETGRVPNPPSDDKLQRLEQTLGFAAGELVSEAHWQRTPSDVRQIVQKLLQEQGAVPEADGEAFTRAWREIFEQSAAQAHRAIANVVPLMNKVVSQLPPGTPLQTEEYISCPELTDEYAFAARIAGDSMAPKYNDGEIVIFSPAVPAGTGDDCFIRFHDGRTTFKRVFFESGKNGPIVRLQPRNERYRPSTVPADKIKGLFKAIYKYHRISTE